MPENAPPPRRTRTRFPLPTGHSPMGRVFEAGEIRHEIGNARRLETRRYPGYALVYVTRVAGDAFYRDENGFSCPVATGDCILVHPDRPHAYGPTPGAEWSEIYISFDGAVFSAMQHWGVLAADRRPVFPGGAADHAPRLRRCVMDETGEPTPMTVAAGRLVALLSELTENRDRARPPLVENWITQAGEALAREGASVAEVCRDFAQRTGFSPDALRKRYRRSTGESMESHRLRSRLNTAITLIERGGTPLKGIAYTLGFSNEQHFSRTIARATGFTPGALRARAGFQRQPSDS